MNHVLQGEPAIEAAEAGESYGDYEGLRQVDLDTQPTLLMVVSQ